MQLAVGNNDNIYWTPCYMLNKNFAFASHLYDVHSLVAANVTALPLGGSK